MKASPTGQREVQALLIPSHVLTSVLSASMQGVVFGEKASAVEFRAHVRPLPSLFPTYFKQPPSVLQLPFINSIPGAVGSWPEYEEVPLH